MTPITHLACACGEVRLAVEGAPILSVECCCASCREAGRRFEARPGAPHVVEANGATHVVLVRKDRVRVATGAERLLAHRLKPGSPTRRVVAGCCGTPIFMDFTKGHWLSLYAGLWPEGQAPRIEMRTMTSDLPPGAVLTDDVPNPRRRNATFFLRLLGAWAAMGFRVPRLEVAGTLAA